MKKILFIYPHFPPSNLSGVHRSRLFVNNLTTFGWEPVLLTVHEKYYEELLDWDLLQLIPKNLRIEKVDAFNITKGRLIGDIGLRAFFQLRKRALQLLQNEKFDFIYIPIPSFYVALLGPYLFKKTGVKYGIDYIDPWVHRFPGSDRIFSRHWFSTKLSTLLEPIAVKKASVITGVAEGYYQGVIERNPRLKQTCLFGAMPYGGDINDHLSIKNMHLEAYIFANNSKRKFMYAGAMLPKGYGFLDAFFGIIDKERELFSNIEFYFIGTGKSPNDPEGFNVKSYALKHNLWHSIIYEYPMRIPYLDVLVHLEKSDGVVIIGSTEPHYTPSKLYQAVLSNKPIFSILHKRSTASDIIKKTEVGVVVEYQNDVDVSIFEELIKEQWLYFINYQDDFYQNQDSLKLFDEFSAKNTTQKLVKLLNEALR